MNGWQALLHHSVLPTVSSKFGLVLCLILELYGKTIFRKLCTLLDAIATPCSFRLGIQAVAGDLLNYRNETLE